MAAGGICKPVDVLISDIDFLQQYLEELAERFAAEGKIDDAEIAKGWSLLLPEVAERVR